MNVPRRIGLVGGIASGKSLASSWFSEHGWRVLDADKVAHGLYAPGTDLAEAVVAEFGPSVRAPDGGIDRRTLGGVVFGDGARMKALEALVHPALRREVLARVDQAVARDERLVLEMALLWRWPEMASRLDLVLGIAAAEPLRLERLQRRNGLSEREAAARLARQEPEERLLSCAGAVLRNEGTADALRDALERRFGPA